MSLEVKCLIAVGVISALMILINWVWSMLVPSGDEPEHSWNSSSNNAPSTGPMTGTPEQIERDAFWGWGWEKWQGVPSDDGSMSTLQEAQERNRK